MTGLQSILVPVPSLQTTDSRSLVFTSTLNGKNESEDKQVVLRRTCVTGVGGGAWRLVRLEPHLNYELDIYSFEGLDLF